MLVLRVCGLPRQHGQHLQERALEDDQQRHDREREQEWNEIPLITSISASTLSVMAVGSKINANSCRHRRLSRSDWSAPRTGFRLERLCGILLGQRRFALC